MWKNRDAVKEKNVNKYPKVKFNQKMEESSKIENDFIDNLKKQIYFMEMELKLMQEREREIAKSGGFTQLFNDDKDPSMHIQQLKIKYANMRKKMEDHILSLNDQKREIVGINVSLKAKLSSIQKLEQELENNQKNRSQEELHEEKQKIKNYKSEFNDIVNKFKIIQDNYINKKAKNALIDDDPKQKAPDLLSNEERKNNFDIKQIENQNEKEVQIKEKKSEQNVFDNNIANLSGVNKIQTINDDTFFNFKRNNGTYKRNCIIFWVILAIIIIVGLITILALKK